MVYIPMVEKGSAIDMYGDLNIFDTWIAKVYWKGAGAKEIAATGKIYDQKRKNSKASAQRSADALCRRYQYYYDTTGKRFEVERQEKLDAKREAKEKERLRIFQIKECAPQMLDILAALMRDIKEFKLDEDNLSIQKRLKEAQEIIELATKPKESKKYLGLGGHGVEMVKAVRTEYGCSMEDAVLFINAAVKASTNIGVQS